MAKRRLNDTSAIARSPSSSEEHTISTEKIDNGYLVRKSTYNNETGECRSSKTFYEKAPRVTEPTVRGESRSGGNSLSDAINSMK
jgi:hypothetical protein